MVPTLKIIVDDKRQETRLKKAVREAKESVGRVKEARKEQRTALENLQHKVPEVKHDVNVGDELDCIMIALNTIRDPHNTDPDHDSDMSRTLEEAKLSLDWSRWEALYCKELNSLQEMGIWELVPHEKVPAGQKIFRRCPIFTIKRDEHGNITRFKTHHVLQGFTMVQGRDFEKTTSPTACAESWQILLHLAAAMGWDATQIDIKTAFLNGVLLKEEQIHMQQPKGFKKRGKKDWVCKLVRLLYGMKQAGCIWNRTLDDAMKRLGFNQLSCEACIYYQKSDQGTVITGVHVDDFLAIVSSKSTNNSFKEELQKIWSILDMGTPLHIVGIAVKWDCPHRHVFLSQTILIDKLTSQYGQSKASPLTVPMEPGLKLYRVDQLLLSDTDYKKLDKIPYRNLVRELLWLAISTHPDIQYVVQQLLQFLDCYSYTH